MEFQRIDPDGLTARQKEIYNYQKAAAILADYGFNCIKLSDDWQGADFLADHMSGKQTLRVQLKSRLAVNRKYENKDLWMIFPEAGNWYLILHDELLRILAGSTRALESKSWRENGDYNYPAGQVPNALLAEIAGFALTATPEKADAQSTMTTQRPEPSRTGLRMSASVDPPAADDAGSPSGGNEWSKYISIRKDRIGRDVVMRLEFDGVKYEVPHDELVRIAGKVTPWLGSRSWKEKGIYKSKQPSKRFLAELRPFILER